MFKDFDQLAKIFERCNPQLPVRKVVTGYDNLAVIKNLRKAIDAITPCDGFSELLEKALNLMMDKHTREDYNYENLYGIDTVFVCPKNEYLKSSGYREKRLSDPNRLFPIYPIMRIIII